MWTSKNGKWKIHTTQDLGNISFLVIAEWVTKNKKVNMIIEEVDGNLEVVESSMPSYHLPAYVRKAAEALVSNNETADEPTEGHGPAENPLSTVNELTQYSEEYLKENYNLELTVPIKINKRLRRALGRFQHDIRNKVPVLIDLSHNLIMHHSLDEIRDVLNHELIHYALYMQGRDFKDGQAEFENELVKKGVSATNEMYCKAPKHIYSCGNCNETTSRRAVKLKDKGSYVSNCCRAPLNYNGFGK